MPDDFFLDAIGIVEGTNKNILEVDYLRHYIEYFSRYRDEDIVVLEIGVSDGNSLRMWERYFSRATIVGIDLQQRCKQYEAGRIKVEIGSQVDTVFLEKLLKTYPPMIIIDDGSHRADFTMTSFKYLFPSLAPGGRYVIEDLYVHFGPGATQWRGEADETPVEFLQKLTANILGAYALPRAKANNAELWENQVDQLGIVSGAAFVRKKRSSGARDEALARAEAVARTSRHPRSWSFIASHALKNGGSLDAAEDAIRKSIELNPKDAIYHQTLAEIFRRRNDVEGAIAVLNNGLATPGLCGGAFLEAALVRLKASREGQAPPPKPYGGAVLEAALVRLKALREGQAPPPKP